MIKKSVFEDELIAGMQRELQPFEKKAAVNDLVKAAEYLHSAVEIFEETGMTTKADQVLKILAKIAVDDNDTAGRKNKDFYKQVMKWIENPETPIEEQESEPEPEVIEFKSLMHPQQPSPSEEDLVFKSIAQELGLDDNDAKPRKPKNPTKVHTPTSKQMIANLKDHGTVFNMTDDGFADDLLDLEVAENPIEVMEPNSDKTFEDTD